MRNKVKIPQTKKIDLDKLSNEEEKEWLNKQAKLLGRYTNFFYRKTIYKVK